MQTFYTKGSTTMFTRRQLGFLKSDNGQAAIGLSGMMVALTIYLMRTTAPITADGILIYSIVMTAGTTLIAMLKNDYIKKGSKKHGRK